MFFSSAGIWGGRRHGNISLEDPRNRPPRYPGYGDVSRRRLPGYRKNVLYRWPYYGEPLKWSKYRVCTVGPGKSGPYFRQPSLAAQFWTLATFLAYSLISSHNSGTTSGTTTKKNEHSTTWNLNLSLTWCYHRLFRPAISRLHLLERLSLLKVLKRLSPLEFWKDVALQNSGKTLPSKLLENEPLNGKNIEIWAKNCLL